SRSYCRLSRSLCLGSGCAVVTEREPETAAVGEPAVNGVKPLHLRLCNLVAPVAPGQQPAARIPPHRTCRGYAPFVPILFHADPTPGSTPNRPRGPDAGKPRSSGSPSPSAG